MRPRSAIRVGGAAVENPVDRAAAGRGDRHELRFGQKRVTALDMEEPFERREPAGAECYFLIVHHRARRSEGAAVVLELPSGGDGERRLVILIDQTQQV